jgi:hypothetical protein
MNQELMDMARQAGIQEGEFERYKGEDGKRKAYMMLPEELVALAALVAAAEREKVAKQWEQWHGFDKHTVATFIRARGETTE